MKDMLIALIATLRRRVEEEVPESGDFKVVFEDFENSDVRWDVTHVALMVEALPKGLEDADVVRNLQLAVYRLPCPYMSTWTILFGTKKQILAKLDEDDLPRQLLDKLPGLAGNLDDI